MAGATKLICDTNVFYDLGAGKISRADLAKEARLYYSPVTVLELAGRWSDRTHQDRKAAARAILDSGAVELLDPESFLTTLFGYDLAEPPFSVAQGVAAMAQSASMKELRAGVPDYAARVARRVSVATAASWRQTTEADWVKSILKIMKDEIPSFDRWYNPDPRRRCGQVPRLRGNAKTEFLAKFKTHDWFLSLLLACQDRAFFKAKRGSAMAPTKETVEKLVAAIDEVACYSAVYTQYLIRCLTEGALPQPNDRGDLELFIYATDDSHVVVTSEKKWVAMATKAGYASRVRVPQRSLGASAL